MTNVSPEIRLADDEIDFAEKYADWIFQSCRRLHSRGKFEGTGIGLASCHKIFKRYQGTFTAVRSPGQGTTPIIIFPQHKESGGNNNE